MTTKRLITAVLVLAAMSACRPDEATTDHLDPAHIMEQRENLSPEVRTHLDSGSAAFRRDDHEAALDHYTQATDIDPNAAAAWFGVYMAQQALGNEEAATEAMARAQSTVPGATLINPTETDTLP